MTDFEIALEMYILHQPSLNQRIGVRGRQYLAEVYYTKSILEMMGDLDTRDHCV